MTDLPPALAGRAAKLLRDLDTWGVIAALDCTLVAELRSIVSDPSFPREVDADREAVAKIAEANGWQHVAHDLRSDKPLPPEGFAYAMLAIFLAGKEHRA